MCKRIIYQLPLTCPQWGTWPATQACAPVGNWNGHLLICGAMPNPLSHTSHFKIKMSLILPSRDVRKQFNTWARTSKERLPFSLDLQCFGNAYLHGSYSLGCWEKVRAFPVIALSIWCGNVSFRLSWNSKSWAKFADSLLTHATDFQNGSLLCSPHL